MEEIDWGSLDDEKQDIQIEEKAILEENVKDIEKIYKEDVNVKDAINSYYTDKAQYEKNVKQIKENLMKNNRVKNTVPNCLYCSRPVGMIFSIEIDKNGNKILYSSCGDKESPCGEKIKIYTGKMTNYMDTIRNYEKILNQLKLKVILFKNDILFGYITEKNIATKFETLKLSIDKTSLELQIIRELYMKNVDNYENYEELCKQEQKYYNYIETLKTKIHNYKIDDTPQSEKIDDIHEIITSYINTFVPLLNSLMKLRYSISEVEYNPDNNEFSLVQIKQQYDISENEYSELPIRVVSNVNMMKVIKPPKKQKEGKPEKQKGDKVKKQKTLKSIKEKVKGDKTRKKTIMLEEIQKEFEEEEKGEEERKEVEEKEVEEEEKEVEGKEVEGKGEEERKEEEEIIDAASLMKHDIKQKIIHSNVDEDELRLVYDIPEIVNREHMYNERIVFRCSSNSASAPPGEGDGEEIPEEDKSEFKDLSKIKDWRRKIANFWTSTSSGDWSAEFTLDGKRWKSVEHYYQASKFKYGHPEFYEKFSLDYNGISVEGHPELVIAEKPSLAKHAGTDGFYEGIRIRPENIEVDEDFFIPTDRKLDKEEETQYRQYYELFIAQRAKFTTNSKMRTLLLSTKDAKLTQSYKPVETKIRVIEPYYYIMYIRNILQKANL